MNNAESQNKNLPKWLIKTQHGSWEPEIFISGIVLIGLIQLPEYLNEFRFYFSREIFGLSTEIDNLIAVLITGIYWMVFGLGIHLFIRGIWIGLVGLSYVFPDGINKDKLNYAQKFDEVINKIPDVTDQIIKLEKISSSIFSINYLMFMCILGAYCFILFLIVLPVYSFFFLTDYSIIEMFEAKSSVARLVNYYANAMMIIGGIYMFDFLSVGLVKKIKYVNLLYYPIYRFVSFITFSKLYRNIYYLLISNFKKWKVITFLTTFIVITLFIIGVLASNSPISQEFSQLAFYGGDSKNSVVTSRYDNMNSTEKNLFASVQNDVIRENTLRLFVSARVDFNDSIQQVCDTNIKDKNSSEYKLSCIKNFYQLTINDSSIVANKWFFHKHPTSNNRGYVTYLDISGLKNGLHEVKVDLQNWTFDTYTIIPFYLDR